MRLSRNVFNAIIFAVMKKYELMVIYEPALKEEGVKKEISLLKEKISSLKASIGKEDYGGIKDLAYEMEKNTSGYYNLLHVELNPDQINEITLFLRRHKSGVLRFLLTEI